MADNNRYKLIYFPIRGRGEFLRYIFAQADVEYDEQSISFEEWPKVKPKMPMGQLPVLEFQGKQLCQSTSIARYLANKYGLAGKNEWDIAYSDMLCQCVEDLFPSFRAYVMAWFAKDEEKKAEEWAKYKENTLRPAFEKFEKLLGDRQFYCGDYVTYADLIIGEYVDRVEKCFDKEFANHFVRLKEHSIRVHDLPKIKKYVEKRPNYSF